MVLVWKEVYWPLRLLEVSFVQKLRKQTRRVAGINDERQLQGKSSGRRPHQDQVGGSFLFVVLQWSVDTLALSINRYANIARVFLMIMRTVIC